VFTPKECVASIGRHPLDLAVDRRKKPSAHTDPHIHTIEFREVQNGTTGNTLAVIVNYAMHPVTLGHVNRKISADWCGAAASEISSATPGQPIVLVTNGAAGNLNPPAESVSPEQVYALGKSVAAAALQSLQSLTTAGSPMQVHSQVVPIELDVLDATTIDHLVDHHLSTIDPNGIWAVPFRAALSNWRRQRKVDLQLGLRTVNIELQLIRLGLMNIVTVNGEMFSRFTQLVRDKVKMPIFTVAYANEAFGYIPTNAAYDEGGYEVETAHFFYNSFRPKRGALELLADRAAAMINAVPETDRPA